MTGSGIRGGYPFQSPAGDPTPPRAGGRRSRSAPRPARADAVPENTRVQYWLLKSEPSVFGIDDLRAAPARRTFWDGVRNYQARNLLRDRMRKGDLAFFYHSSCAEPAIVGIVEITSAGYPDPTAFDPGDPHYDPKSDPASPRWYGVDVRLERRLRRPVTLQTLRSEPALARMQLLQRGNRLSVMPVSEREWNTILALS